MNNFCIKIGDINKASPNPHPMKKQLVLRKLLLEPACKRFIPEFHAPDKQLYLLTFAWSGPEPQKIHSSFNEQDFKSLRFNYIRNNKRWISGSKISLNGTNEIRGNLNIVGYLIARDPAMDFRRKDIIGFKIW